MRDPRGGYTSSKPATELNPPPRGPAPGNQGTTADLYEGYLKERGSTLFGRVWNIHHPDERRECAEWLASIHDAATSDRRNGPA